jgi:pyridoxine 4-dehydrogenase
VATAWVRQQGALPIPGATTVERVTENTTSISLSEEELQEIQKILDMLEVKGERYGGPLEALNNL